MKIEIYKHYFKVSAIDFSKLIFDLRDFNKDLVTYKMVVNKTNKYSPSEVTNEIDRTLYLIDNIEETVRYPISLLDKFKERFDHIELNINKSLQGEISKFIFNPNKVARGYQEEYVDVITTTKFNNLLINLYTGYGKSCEVDTPVKLKHGWKPIGEIKVGEEVIGRDGKLTTVTGVYPQGVLQLYKVTFIDGRYVNVCLEHLWSVYINSNIKSKVIKTEDIINHISENTLAIDLVKDIFIDKDDYINDVDMLSKIIYDNVNTIDNILETEPILIKDNVLRNDLINFSRAIGLLCFIKDELISFIKDDVLRIANVEKVHKAKAVCISVDNKDKLYVVKDYIVTHNTMISLLALSKIGKKFMVLILPRYISKWIDDITEDTDIIKEEILVVQGLTMLLDILNNPNNYKQHKCIIMSLTTISIFISHYLKNEILKIGMYTPDDIIERLRVEVVLNDEAHQNFFAVYNFMLFCNHRLTIGLTATLVHADEHISKMYQLGFPDEHRISNIIKFERYTSIYVVRFKFRDKRRIKFKNNFGYNQHKFEASILRYYKIKLDYFKMLLSLINHFYVKKYNKDDKDKCMVFFGSVKMCTEFNDFIKVKLPTFNTTKYTEKEKYNVIDENDIISSTLKSAGTALDIKNLIFVLLTYNTDSKADNEQALGRLRKLKDKEVIFVNVWSPDIPAHGKYLRNKNKLYGIKGKLFKHIVYNHLIG